MPLGMSSSGFLSTTCSLPSFSMNRPEKSSSRCGLFGPPRRPPYDPRSTTSRLIDRRGHEGNRENTGELSTLDGVDGLGAVRGSTQDAWFPAVDSLLPETTRESPRP
jgi:hypothetical protein